MYIHITYSTKYMSIHLYICIYLNVCISKEDKYIYIYLYPLHCKKFCPICLPAMFKDFRPNCNVQQVSAMFDCFLQRFPHCITSSECLDQDGITTYESVYLSLSQTLLAVACKGLEPFAWCECSQALGDTCGAIYYTALCSLHPASTQSLSRNRRGNGITQHQAKGAGQLD